MSASEFAANAEWIRWMEQNDAEITQLRALNRALLDVLFWIDKCDPETVAAAVEKFPLVRAAIAKARGEKS